MPPNYDIHKIMPSKLHASFSHKLQCIPIFFNIFLQDKMGMLTTDILDEDNYDDEFNSMFDDEDNDLGLGSLFAISELQVTR